MKAPLVAACALALLGWSIAAPACAPFQARLAASSIRVLTGSQDCGRMESTATIRQAGDEASFERLLSEHQLAGKGPDFNREIAVLVALGQRPTLGYALEPGAPQAPVRDGTAFIPLVVHEPPPEAMVGQAISSPCLVLALERQGLSAVEARDQKGRLLGRVVVE